MPASKDRTFEVARRVLAAAKGIVPQGQFEAATINAVALTLFWRAVSLYEATILLARHEHVEEGLILARSLFEDSLVVHEIYAAESHRAALVVKWMNRSLAEKEELMKEAERLEFAGDQAAVLAQLAKYRQQIQAFGARHGVNKPKAFLSTKDAAFKFGRKTDYWTYQFAHEFTHGSDAAAVFRRRRDASGGYVFHGRTGDARLTVGLIAFASRSLLQISRAVACLLIWEDRGEIARVETLVGALET